MLDVKTLKVARQVSKSWNSEATPLLFSKGYLQVPPNIYDNWETKESQKMMKNFLASSSFKIRNIKMANPRDQKILLSVLGTHNVDMTELKIPEN